MILVAIGFGCVVWLGLWAEVECILRCGLHTTTLMEDSLNGHGCDSLLLFGWLQFCVVWFA